MACLVSNIDIQGLNFCENMSADWLRFGFLVRTLLYELSPFNALLDLLLVSQSGLTCKGFVKTCFVKVVAQRVLSAEVQQLCLWD